MGLGQNSPRPIGCDGLFLGGMAVWGVGASLTAAAAPAMAGPPLPDHPGDDGGSDQNQKQRYHNVTPVGSDVREHGGPSLC